MEYSPAMASLTMAAYISFRTLVLFFIGISNILKLSAICTRVDEVMAMAEYTQDKSVMTEYEHTDLALHCKRLTASREFKLKKDVYTGDAEVLEVQTDVLKNISFDAEITGLVAVVGSVGSGKSSLLAAVMNELSVRRGTIKRRGKV